MALVDSLLTAMVRADGDALVMHVGERPIVVSGSRTVDLSNHGMNLGAMVGMLSQLLSLDAQAMLRELGAVEHELPARESDRFSVVAARSGDDIWIEIRRRREALASSPASEPAALPAPAGDQPEEATADLEVAGEAPTAEPVEFAEASPADPVGHADGPVEPEALSEPDLDELPQAVAEPAQDADADATDLETDAEIVAETVADSQTTGAAIVAESQTTDAAIEATDLANEATDPAPEASDADDAPTVFNLDSADEPLPADVAPDEAAGMAAIAPVEASLPDDASAQDEAPAEFAPELARVEATQPVATAHAEDTSVVVEPAVAVASSAAASLHSVSTFVSGPSMDAARYPGHSASGPPPESSAPVTPSEPAAAGQPADSGARLPDAPVTRTVRIEVPERASSSRASGIDRLLRAADSLGASELFLVSQSRPYVRVGGNVRPLQDEPVLLGSDIETLIADVTPEPWRDAVRRGDPADWLIELSEVGRVRCASFRDHRGPGANFHFAFLRAATADDLQLNAETRRLATEPDGLVLVSGAAGSEVSAIVASFVDLLNQQRADYIITLEPQVRTLHVNREALVSQREVGTDPARAAAAALAALREQPDVLVIEALASGELAQLAIDAAAQHRLVIVSIEAPSSTAAMQRLIELVPADQRPHARQQLARCFRGAVAQLMLRKAAGGKIAARELLPSTRAVTQLLADGELPRLADQLETAAATGLAPIADTVVDYVRTGVVDVREAVRKAPDAARLVDRLRTAGADLSGLDGWN